MGENTFTTKSTERTELPKGIFSVVSVCSVVRSSDKPTRSNTPQLLITQESVPDYSNERFTPLSISEKANLWNNRTAARIRLRERDGIS